VAPPPPRPALGALFLLLAIAFAGIGAAAVEAVDSNKGLIVVVVAAGVIALWLLTLAVRNLRRKPGP
jgi:multidrug transporter EmrE-like cation transporter